MRTRSFTPRRGPRSFRRLPRPRFAALRPRWARLRRRFPPSRSSNLPTRPRPSRPSVTSTALLRRKLPASPRRWIGLYQSSTPPRRRQPRREPSLRSHRPRAQHLRCPPRMPHSAPSRLVAIRSRIHSSTSDPIQPTSERNPILSSLLLYCKAASRAGTSQHRKSTTLQGDQRMTDPRQQASPATDDQVAAIRSAAAALQADVYYLSGTLSRATDSRLREVSEQSRRHDRCVLALTTSGGDADAAYLIARFLRRVYKRVTVCVFGYCKSAGTLLALGCHEVAMGLRGELGPLDVQVSEKDELARFGSGLEIVTSLNFLTETAFASFERYLVTTVQRSGGQISTKTAAEIATNLTVGLVAPISGQIDPIRLGREQRAMEIASAYAERLGISPQAIARLTAAYPDHGFVIDLTEAKQFLDHARELEPPERDLEVAVASVMPGVYLPDAGQDIVICLTESDASAVQPNLHAEETDGGLPTDPEGDSGEAPFEDPGVRSPSDEAHGPTGPSDLGSAPAGH